MGLPPCQLASLTLKSKPMIQFLIGSDLYVWSDEGLGRVDCDEKNIHFECTRTQLFEDLKYIEKYYPVTMI